MCQGCGACRSSGSCCASTSDIARREACGSWLALAVGADPLRLQAFTRDFLDKVHRRAHREMLERRRDHVVAREVVLAPVLGGDEPDALLGVEARHATSVLGRMKLHIAALAARVVLEPPPGGV